MTKISINLASSKIDCSLYSKVYSNLIINEYITRSIKQKYRGKKIVKDPY